MRLFGKVDNDIDHYDRPHFFGSVFDRPFYHEFPVLSRAPSHRQFKEGPAFDPTLRSEFAGGAVLTRARGTVIPMRWDVLYEYLTAADKTVMETLQTNTVVGSDSFRWSHPVSSTIYTVRLGEPVIFTMEPRLPNRWRVQLVLIEA